ncbi:MAG: FUSC family protein [Acinetobacter oleivorans]|nr:FUSC family protein [Acinetobacter oleivorans]
MNTNISHGLRLSIAAWLSFSIAILLGVDNAYWAAMPVWVISQQVRGMMFQRGAYRIIGTLAGALLGLTILKATNNAWIIISLISFTIFITIFSMRVSHGTKGYAPQMMAVTIIIILVPALMLKNHAWELALSRIQCTFIGVILVTVITTRYTQANNDEIWYSGLLKWSPHTIHHHHFQKHQDNVKALRFALLASTGVLLCAITFHQSGWSAGELVTLGTCIFTMALASLKDPYDMALKMFIGVIFGVCLAFFYRFAIQPYFLSTSMIILTILPFFLIGGLLRCWPKTAAPALDGNMCFLLASQAGMSAVSIKTAFNECLALIVAAALVSFAYRLVLRQRH